jgi:fluoroacetyl-CoA thioesterase
MSGLHIVTRDDTAAAVGSGDVDVLGTPRLIGWLEGATLAALDLPDNETSVGTRVDIEHLVASPLGARVDVSADLTHRDGRLCRFRVVAHHDVGDGPVLIAQGEVTRVIVDRARFDARTRRGIMIRPATPHEWYAVGELCVTAYSTGDGLSGDTDTYVRDLRDVAAHASEADVLVAYAEGDLVGTVTVIRAGCSFADLARPGEVEFRFMAVHPEWWGRGVAPALLDAVLLRAGTEAVVCCVIEGNEAAATRYEQAGFTRDPSRDREAAPGVLLRAFRRDP